MKYTYPMNIPNIAFVTMEFGLDNNMNTYCGGLGILSGDIIKSATDMSVRMTGITILYKNGWFKQSIDDKGYQVATSDTWDYQKYLTDTNLTFTINIHNESVKVKLWEYTWTSNISGFSNTIYFVDTDVDGNSDLIKQASNKIYHTDKSIWYCQEILLALSTIEVNKILNLKIDIYHLNESHAACLALALYDEVKDWNKVRQSLVFTTHTPLEAAHQKFNIDDLKNYLPSKYVEYIPKELIVNSEINFTKLSLFASKFSNAVAKRHEEVSDKMYPEFSLDHVTNGVHIDTWVCSGLGMIYDKYLTGWKNDPNILRQIGVVPDEEIESNHHKNKINLCDYVNDKYHKNLDPNIFTIGFARRTVGYKRADMILTQLERLKTIAKKYNKIQIIFSGKAYPTDDEGIKLIKSLVDASKIIDPYLNIVFIEDYDMAIAKKMVLGVDLWLNNPIPPLEASGTSGMKASLNGIPNFSILDGWWVEGHLEGITGWSIGEDLCVGDVCKLIEIEDLYSKLENQIYHAWNDKAKWARMRKTCIALNGTYFNTYRVVQEYILKGYLK
jgi:glycogen phosphorylase